MSDKTPSNSDLRMDCPSPEIERVMRNTIFEDGHIYLGYDDFTEFSEDRLKTVLEEFKSSSDKDQKQLITRFQKIQDTKHHQKKFDKFWGMVSLSYLKIDMRGLKPTDSLKFVEQFFSVALVGSLLKKYGVPMYRDLYVEVRAAIMKWIYIDQNYISVILSSVYTDFKEDENKYFVSTIDLPSDSLKIELDVNFFGHLRKNNKKKLERSEMKITHYFRSHISNRTLDEVVLVDNACTSAAATILRNIYKTDAKKAVNVNLKWLWLIWSFKMRKK